MSRPSYVCTVCSQHFTRKFSANRHNFSIHGGRSEIVPYIEYMVGRSSGCGRMVQPLQTQIDSIAKMVQPLQKQLKSIERQNESVKQLSYQLKQLQKQMSQVQKDSQKTRSFLSKKPASTKRKTTKRIRKR